MRVNNPLTHYPPLKPTSAPVDTPFIYRTGQLYCEDVPLAAIAAAVATPVYVYSRAEIERRARAFLETAATLTGEKALVCYAVKANANPTLLRLLAEAGLGADVTSGGELFLARHAGFPAADVIFSGVGKKAGEIAEALAARSAPSTSNRRWNWPP